MCDHSRVHYLLYPWEWLDFKSFFFFFPYFQWTVPQFSIFPWHPLVSFHKLCSRLYFLCFQLLASLFWTLLFPELGHGLLLVTENLSSLIMTVVTWNSVAPHYWSVTIKLSQDGSSRALPFILVWTLIIDGRICLIKCQ